MSDASDDSNSRRKWRDIPLSFTVVIILVIAIFVSAGNLGWGWGWTLAGIMIVNRIVTLFFLDPGLLKERTSIRHGYKGWDILLSTIMGRIAPLFIIVTSGLDYRFGWARGFPTALNVTGIVLIVLAYLLILLSIKENRFFSAIVRIQTDRGHHVITTGPYGIVRHPGYSGTILHTLSLPLVLGSYFSFIPAFTAIILAFVRIIMEDNTLKRELEGYTEYAEKVRYRIIPGIW
jgi:protein-S-isoprenylcysteine O-methyltransferase Ste14